MKHSKKIALIVAVALIAVGTVAAFGAWAASGFDFKKMGTVDCVTKTYAIEEAFTDISVKNAGCDIRFAPSDDGSCKIVCTESEKISHSVTVQDNTLTVERQDQGKWYERIGIFRSSMEITVYLPQSEYASLHITGTSGTIDIPRDFTFGTATLETASGDINFFSAVRSDLSVETASGDLHIRGVGLKSLRAQTDSGDITLSSVKAEALLSMQTTSGDIELTDVECGNATAQSSSGEITFSGLIAAETIHIESTSGDVDLLECDAHSLSIRTTSGDVCGSLLTDKVFFADTDSGNISLPKTTTGGVCEISSVSGDIRFTVK